MRTAGERFSGERSLARFELDVLQRVTEAAASGSSWEQALENVTGAKRLPLWRLRGAYVAGLPELGEKKS